MNSTNGVYAAMSADLITKTEVAVTMKKYGGAFIRSLADTWFVADPSNQAKIEGAFAAEFNKYHDLAEQMRGVPA